MLSLKFDNRFVTELPADPEIGARTRTVHGAAFSFVQPTPVAQPELVAYSPEMLSVLELSEADISRAECVNVLAGNAILAGMQPYAMNYGGHQFGHWAGQLGDGRAISLGEAVTANGARWELQLKGAGQTPYSRRADGRAVLRSSIREFLCSEAMHHLGIPTTRALSLVKTGDWVQRDMFYDGNPENEAGAIVCRVAPSFIRFGHFQLPAQRADVKLLERLIDFTVARDFPHLTGDVQARRVEWFYDVCRRTAVMVAHWMRVGFVHGVMNTDNMSILGLTLDYGPYGWLENYDLNWTPNTTDEYGRRYAYGQQPAVAHWNLARLGEAILPVLQDADAIQAGLTLYADTYGEVFSGMLAAKLGIRQLEDSDGEWVNRLFELLQGTEVDMTLFFRGLAELDLQTLSMQPFLDAFYNEDVRLTHADAWQQWLLHYRARLEADNLPRVERQTRMNAANPQFVLRNYLAQQAIDAAHSGDYGLIRELLDASRHPYKKQPHYAHFYAKRPEWARHKAGCSMLSCSS